MPCTFNDSTLLDSCTVAWTTNIANDVRFDSVIYFQDVCFGQFHRPLAANISIICIVYWVYIYKYQSTMSRILIYQVPQYPVVLQINAILPV